MIRGCVGRASTFATVTRPLRQCRGYAEGGGDLHSLAKQIESSPSKRPQAVKGLTASTRGASQSGSSILPFAQRPITKTIPLPANYVQFEVDKPYNPYDFTPKNRLPPAYRRYPQGAPSRAIAIRQDPFHQLNIDPLDEVLNCGLISYHATEMGRIQRRADSKLTWKSQRKMGKAIRRARAMGLVPAFSRWNTSMVRLH